MSLQEIDNKLNELEQVLTEKGFSGPKFNLISSLFCQGYVLKKKDVSKLIVLQSSEHNGISFNDTNSIEDIPKFYIQEFQENEIDDSFQENKNQILSRPYNLESEQEYYEMILEEKFMFMVSLGYINPLPDNLVEMDIQYLIDNKDQIL